jgi:hypothetical protein
VAGVDAAERQQDQQAEDDRRHQPADHVGDHHPPGLLAREQRVDGREARRADRAPEREQDDVERHVEKL